MLNHNYIGTEHILLGLILEEEGVAGRALHSLGISPEDVRTRIEEIVGPGSEPPTGHIPFTPRGKKVLELSLREALQLGHNYIGTEHILLGLIREGEGVAAQVLIQLGADLDRVRQTVIDLLSGYAGGEVAEAAGETRYAEISSEGDVPDTEPVGIARPNCPRCHAALTETLAVSEIGTTVNDEAPLSVKVAYCGRCGSALGVVP